MKVPLVYDTNDAAVRLKMDDEVRAIEALPVVSELAQLAASRSKEAGFQASLRCSAHCKKKQESPVHISNSRTTLFGCLQELRMRLETRHGDACVAAAEAARGAEAAAKAAAATRAGAGSSAESPNTLAAMMRLQAAKVRAEAANKAALEAEKAKDAAEEEVEALRWELEPK